MVVTCSMDASFRDGSTPSPWHADAVGGRPPHHVEPAAAPSRPRRRRGVGRYPPACAALGARPPWPVATPTALALAIVPVANCARYDQLRSPPAEDADHGAAWYAADTQHSSTPLASEHALARLNPQEFNDPTARARTRANGLVKLTAWRRWRNWFAGCLRRRSRPRYS